MTNTIGQRFLNSVGMYTVAFNLPACKVVVWANQWGKEYRFSDGSGAIVSSNTQGKAIWSITLRGTNGVLVATKLVGVLSQYRP